MTVANQIAIDMTNVHMKSRRDGINDKLSVLRIILQPLGFTYNTTKTHAKHAFKDRDKHGSGALFQFPQRCNWFGPHFCRLNKKIGFGQNTVGQPGIVTAS